MTLFQGFIPNWNIGLIYIVISLVMLKLEMTENKSFATVGMLSVVI